MSFLASQIPPTIAVQLGPLSIHWYAIAITLGALFGFLLFRKLARERGIGDTAILDCALWVLIIGFLGARIYHVLNEPEYYAAHPLEIFAIWNGGLAMHGGMIAGVFALWFFARRQRLPFLTVLDTVAPALLLGQAIGRWGNYFNQELFGRPTDLAWKLFIAPEHRPVGYENVQFFHPTFLYESLGLLLAIAALLALRHRATRIPGALALSAIFLSQAIRFLTELIRIDRTPDILGARLPLLVSALAMFFAGLIFIRITRHGFSHNN